MCTLIIFRDSSKDSRWPVLIAENRDENPKRPWEKPSSHWEEYPRIIAGLDLASGTKGSWLGVNYDGVFCTIINRSGTIGQKSDKESRGGLVIKALTFTSAAEAATCLVSEINPSKYQGFYLVIADKISTQVIISDGLTIAMQDLKEGLHIITSRGIDNIASCSRARMHLADWRSAPLPEPDINKWDEWIDILARKSEEGVRDGMALENVRGSSTISSALVALSADGYRNKLLFAPGKPKECSYEDIDIRAKDRWISHLKDEVKKTSGPRSRL